MTTQPTGRSFLESGLDWTTDSFTPEEKVATLAWYEDNHEAGGTSLSNFPRFWIEHDPGGFKRYRRHMIEIDQPQDGVVLPQAAHLLMYLTLYTTFANEKGIVYLAINARALGATRDEVIDAFRLAALPAGPYGLNAAAELADQYLRDWELDSDEPGITWPADWAPDPDALKSGIDLSHNELTDADADALRAWYLRVYGEIPSHVEALMRFHPVAYKTQRIRLEAALGSALPAQMAPLSLLLLATQRQSPKAILRAAQIAKALGVRRHQLVETLFWAGVYSVDETMEVAFDALDGLLDGWE
jgi:alkylhydroperoxidase/carboxymuconolactone decarboxylase family protein YurZ